MLSELKTGIVIEAEAAWSTDAWQFNTELFGWRVEAGWSDGAFSVTVSPDESLGEGLPTYTLDSRDFEKLLKLLYGLFEEIPDTALSFSLSGSFRIDTTQLAEYISWRAPLYLKSHEREISALIEKYVPLLTLISPNAELWSDVEWLGTQLQRLARKMPRFTASADFYRKWSGNWQMNVSVNENMLSASGDDDGNIAAFLSLNDTYGNVQTYTMDIRGTDDGAELLFSANDNGRTYEFTILITEDTDGMLIEAYTEKEEFYIVLEMSGSGAELQILLDGEAIAEGSVHVSGDYVYIDLAAAGGLTLDGVFEFSDGRYTMSLLVNGRPITGRFEYSAYSGWVLEYYSSEFELEASSGAALKLYARADELFNINRRSSLSVELDPMRGKYSFILKESLIKGASLDFVEYGFSYVPGRLTIMNGAQSVAVTDVSEWTEDCLSAVDISLMQKGYKSESMQIVTRAKSDTLLETTVYENGSDECMLTVTIDLKPEPVKLPEPVQWLTAEELMTLLVD